MQIKSADDKAHSVHHLKNSKRSLKAFENELGRQCNQSHLLFESAQGYLSGRRVDFARLAVTIFEHLQIQEKKNKKQEQR